MLSAERPRGRLRPRGRPGESPCARFASSCSPPSARPRRARARLAVDFRQLSSNAVEDSAPQVSGERVVWQHDVDEDTEIMLFDGASSSPAHEQRGARRRAADLRVARALEAQRERGQVPRPAPRRRLDPPDRALVRLRRRRPPRRAVRGLGRQCAALSPTTSFSTTTRQTTSTRSASSTRSSASRASGTTAARRRPSGATARGLWFYDGENVDQLSSGAVAEHQLGATAPSGSSSTATTRRSSTSTAARSSSSPTTATTTTSPRSSATTSSGAPARARTPRSSTTTGRTSLRSRTTP